MPSVSSIHTPRLVLAALGAALCLVTAEPAAASPQSRLTPTVTCVEVNGDGTITAHFGWVNTWGSQVTVQVGNRTGNRNFFSPGAEDRGQPTQFAPGTRVDVFTVTFSGSSLTWTLDDSKDDPANDVTATASSTACTSVPGLGLDTPLPLALLTVCLGAVVAWRRGRQPSGATA